MHYSAVPALLAASALLTADPKQAVVSAFVVPSAHTHASKVLLAQSHNDGHHRPNQYRCTSSLLKADHSSSGGGDQLRASTGIRPSLHPTTINAISEALLLRHSAKNNKPIDVWADNDDDDDDATQPLDVAVTAGAISSDLLEKRKTSCEADGDVSSIPTPEECQTVAGRVVGVVMRMRPLEMELAKRVNAAKWVAKYGEHGSFGVLKSECKQAAAAAAANEDEGEGGEASSSDVKIETDAKIEKELTDRIRDDPLFRMCRAECLLAIFLDTVEAPKLQEVGESVPGGSSVDFIDEDRREVILS